MKPIRTTAQEKERRRALCDACPHRWIALCGKCGCPIVSKINFQRASCPLGKW